MARPRPVPGLVSSSRLPRFSASRALSSGMPGPSSSIDHREHAGWPASAPARPRPTPPPCSSPISWRCRADCRRSPRDPRARRQTRISSAGSVSVTAVSRIELLDHPHHALQRRRRPACGRRRCRAARRRGRAADNARPASAWPTPGRRSAVPLSPPSARPSLSSTASGVFSECARLPTCVRERSTMRWLFSISALVSLASGSISAGKRPSSRCAVPSRTMRQRLAHPAAAAAGRAGWRPR